MKPEEFDKRGKSFGRELSPEEADKVYEKIFGHPRDNETGTPLPSQWIQLKEKSTGEWHWFLKTELEDDEFPREEYE